LQGWPSSVGAFDLALVGLGVNDVKGLSRREDFEYDLKSLLKDLKTTSPEGVVVLLGLPPMQHFISLPQPLRAWLAGRAYALDRSIQNCARDMGSVFVPFEIEVQPGLFAADGFHPSEKTHAIWAQNVVAGLGSLERWRNPGSRSVNIW
jgi:lysophospholipase L1-like esterase